MFWPYTSGLIIGVSHYIIRFELSTSIFTLIFQSPFSPISICFIGWARVLFRLSDDVEFSISYFILLMNKTFSRWFRIFTQLPLIKIIMGLVTWFGIILNNILKRIMWLVFLGWFQPWFLSLLSKRRELGFVALFVIVILIVVLKTSRIHKI